MNYDPFLSKIRIRKREGFEKWCEENISLATDFAAMPGPFSLDLTPYMRFPYRCLDYGTKIKMIDLMFGAQLGKTQMVLNWMMYRQESTPGPMMFILPTIKNALKFSKQRVDKMIEGTPAMARLMEKDGGRIQSQTMDLKRWPGGFCMFVGSNSRSDLASTPIRDLLMDEIDRYCKDVGGEGSPIELGIKRTTTFYNSVIIKTSTPTIFGESEIESSFQRSTKFFFYVPCPFCFHHQTLEIENLYPDGYECEKCKKKIDDRQHKHKMLSLGEWRTNGPLTPHYGFHLSQLYAPYLFVPWERILKEKEEAKNDVEKLIVFKNTVLAVTHREVGEYANWKEVKERTVREYREKIVWDDTVALTMAVDVQKDHLVYEIRGWKKNLVSYSLTRGQLIGAIGEEVARYGLESLMEKKFKDQHGVSHKISLTLIDSSYDTADVYSFCRTCPKGSIFPIKGVDEQAFPISAPVKAQLRKGGRKLNPRGLFFYKIGVSLLKKRIYSTFNLSEDEYKDEKTWRRIFYPTSYDQEWFEQLCSEQLIDVRNKTTNQVKKVWKKQRDRNEALDLAVYNLAAAHILQLDERDLKKVKAIKTGKRPIAEKKRDVKKKKKPDKKRQARGIEIGI